MLLHFAQFISGAHGKGSPFCERRCAALTAPLLKTSGSIRSTTMHNIHNLRVFKKARENLKLVSRELHSIKSYGDLRNQIQRAAISVVSNIAEGAGSDSDKQWKRFLNISRGSNTELHAQLLIISDLHPREDFTDLIENITYVGKMLTRLIQNTG